MDASFGFFFDPGLTTKVRGRVVMTVDADGNGRDLVVYFGSPVAGRYCEADGGGDVIISVTGPLSAGVQISDVPGVFSGSQSVSIGARVDGGAVNMVPVYLRSDAAAASLVITCCALAEYQP